MVVDKFSCRGWLLVAKKVGRWERDSNPQALASACFQDKCLANSAHPTSEKNYSAEVAKSNH